MNAERARELTSKCQNLLEQTQNILRAALKSQSAISWEKLITKYPLPKPEYPKIIDCPPKPTWTKAFEQIKARDYPDAVTQWKIEHEQAIARWTETFKQAEAENIRRHNEHTAAIERWDAGRLEYERNEVAKLRFSYESLLPSGIVKSNLSRPRINLLTYFCRRKS